MEANGASIHVNSKRVLYSPLFMASAMNARVFLISPLSPPPFNSAAARSSVHTQPPENMKKSRGKAAHKEEEEEEEEEEEKGKDAKTTVEIQEKGEIFFFYRPKVDKEEAHAAADVQRLYLVLRPAAETPVLRLIVMGRKSLPDPSKKSSPYWGFVELVATSVQHIKAALKGREYDTQTRGHRHLPDCRAAGEGVYRILRHNYSGNRQHSHLVYKLEFPREGAEGDPQEALNIAREASFLIQIKNPDHPGIQRAKKKAVFPAHLQGLFGHKQYHEADPPEFLNYAGCEFLLISASDDIEEELGLDVKIEHDECPDLVQTFGEDAASLRPLFEGTWD